ncbi:hypothetical protein PGTUg99_035951 [Puccinia graminis f. sp. tritici]|uniref:Uncharacterized protein n=1 Tax=Puccinia graminis f. sp. tritici TaxID=56615 RepID=A0A5B0S8W4_PUCGR|nr:hypothetical protein PGTUg99_035951 [Puccinia graminis f. sp. tritici]
MNYESTPASAKPENSSENTTSSEDTNPAPPSKKPLNSKTEEEGSGMWHPSPANVEI